MRFGSRVVLGGLLVADVVVGAAPAQAVAGLVAALLLAACGAEETPAHLRVVGGDPETGRSVIASYGCPGCHSIPGVRAFSGTVGPPLDSFAERRYIAGLLPNRPAMLTLWLRDPPGVDPETAMPALGVSEADARHMAAYLYTLR